MSLLLRKTFTSSCITVADRHVMADILKLLLLMFFKQQYVTTEEIKLLRPNLLMKTLFSPALKAIEQLLPQLLHFN